MIIEAIFKSLSSADRGRCRLVCREWYEACTPYEKKEKLCISNVYNDNLDAVISTLTKSTRSCFNLEFYGINFKRNPRKKFWTTCGPRIVSLKLVNCRISSPPFSSILKYCFNMHTLELYYDDMEFMRYGLSVACPSKDIPTNLRNQSLRTLTIHFHKHRNLLRGTLHWLEKVSLLFYLFPNITNFSFRHHDVYGDTSDEIWLDADRQLEFFDEILPHVDSFKSDCEKYACGRLQNYFLRNQMESIAIYFLYYPWFGWTLLNDLASLSR